MPTCPRCTQPLLERWISREEGESDVCAHLCEKCAGVWLDEEALAGVCPTLSHLPEHRMEVALTAARGVGIQRCPRCSAVPHEITVLEVAVDFCTGCGGVWLDGGEYDEKGTVAKPRGGGRAPYRRAAVASSNELSCAHCGVPLSRERALVREHGATCEPCSFALDQRIAALRAEADPLSRFLQRVAEILLG